MTEIKIPKSITPLKLKDLYDQFVTPHNLNNITLIIPGEISKYTFGLLADILRFVITVNGKHGIKILKIELIQEELESLYDQEYAYPIISLLWNTSIFIDKNGNNIKGLLRERQNDFFIKMNSLARIKGTKFILTNADHLSDNKGLIRLLENKNGFNDDERQIEKQVKRILTDYVLTFNKNNVSEIDGIMEDIGAIVYELTKNTYEWGKTDINWVAIPASIRGVYLRFHINNNEKIVEEYTNTPLSAFFKNPAVIENCLNDLGQIYYLEILVFDSGIGFIEKYYPKEGLSDIEIIKRCLVKNQTSSTTNLKSKKGIGLDRILKTLHNKGFLRISTDKYCVYRDLIKDKYLPISTDNLEELVLEDWNKIGVESKNLTKSQGSYISILYPFKYNK